MNDFLSGIDEAVIAAESNPARFERFCNKVVSNAEGGVAVVNTSMVWDRARDGRGVGLATGLYVCCSLRDDVDVKAIEDIERLSQTTKKIKKLYFCSSKPLTEHRCDQISAVLAEYFDPSTTVTVLGAKQLAELGRGPNGDLEKIYGAEVRDILARLDPPSSDREDMQGLRLALLSTGAEDSAAIRESVYKNALLDTLSDQRGRTIDKICVDISAILRLGRPVDKLCLKPYMDSLKDESLVNENAGIFTINDCGLKHLDDKKTVGASSLIEGRAAIRKVFEEAVGASIIDDDFQRIWTVFEDRLSFYLQSRGEQIVAEVMTLFGQSDALEDHSDKSQLSFLEELADSVAATVRHVDRQEPIRQSVKDLFSDRTGDAAKWLVSVCAAFIAACTMGLESRSGEVVRDLMRRINLVLDTDVLISLVAEGEPEHEAVSLIVKKWREIRGKVLVGTPVLQEVAYHAFISKNDFEQVKFNLPGSEDYRLRIIDNAFVRSFAHLLSHDSAIRLNHWGGYISQFRGSAEYDVTNVSNFVVSEYGIERLPDRDSAKAGDVEAVKKFLLDLMERQKLRVGRNERDKSTRDAELYVSLSSHLANLRSLDPDAGCLLVSSSRKIAAVDSQFGMSGESNIVISIASALYLIGTLPTVSLGLSALKAFLFDDRKSRFSSDLERTILRMVSSSKEHSAFVFSRRNLLVREVKKRLVSRADAIGASLNKSEAAEVERMALSESGKESLITALAESLDVVSSDSRTHERLRNTLAELEETKRQLELERGRRKK